MKKNYFALLRYKFNLLRAASRKSYYRFLGMHVDNSAVLGKIKCDWPDKITIGSKSVIEDNVVFKIPRPFSDYNFVKIGENVFIGSGCNFNITLGLTIGNDCLIASNTTFVDAGREIGKEKKINLQPCIHNEITIADDVWIGTQCVVLKGVSIGKGSIVGAGSVVNKSIPEYQIWAGTPAKFIKNRI